MQQFHLNLALPDAFEKSRAEKVGKYANLSSW
jgi:hypothetical protein